MSVPIYVVDAFASRPFTGNPAGVCLLSEHAAADWMQKVAAEMKHAETAFVVPDRQGFGLRWFTPTAEVDLCGHATLAAAHILWETGAIGEEEEALFHTKSGALTCSRHGYGIQMDFPAEPIQPDRSVDPQTQVALGNPKVNYVGANRMDVLIELESAEAVRRIRPDFGALGKLDARGVMVTAAASSPDCDFVSRFFAPAFGVPEDPVTGSAHCCLGPYWATKLGKDNLIGYQCSARGGTVRVAVRGSRVLLQGHAITMVIGEFL